MLPQKQASNLLVASSNFATWDLFALIPPSVTLAIFSHDSLSHPHSPLVPWTAPVPTPGTSGVLRELPHLLYCHCSFSLPKSAIFLVSEKGSNTNQIIPHSHLCIQILIFKYSVIYPALGSSVFSDSAKAASRRCCHGTKCASRKT